MKPILFLFCFLLPASTFCQNKSDTIHVAPGSTTYLAFPEDISLVDIGNKEFAFKVEKNILLLRSDLPQGKITDMLIKYGTELFTAWLVHDVKPSRSLYDFRGRLGVPRSEAGRVREHNSQAGTIKPQDGAVNSGNKEVDSSVTSHLSQLGNREEKFRTCGIVKHSMVFLLVNVMNDSACIYMRFKVTNQSSLPYNLDYVSFECRRKGHRETKILQPLISPPSKQISGHHSEFLSYALPAFALGEGGSYDVTFRESGGNRKAVLSIPSKTVALSGTFQNVRK